jgi:hypothetical protein
MRPEELGGGELDRAFLDADGSIRNALGLYGRTFKGKIERIE